LDVQEFSSSKRWIKALNNYLFHSKLKGEIQANVKILLTDGIHPKRLFLKQTHDPKNGIDDGSGERVGGTDEAQGQHHAQGPG